MKSKTFIVGITNQKNEKCLHVGRNPVVWSPPRLLASCQLRNFPRKFTEKCLPFLTNQAAQFISRGIGCSYFSGNFLLSLTLRF